MSVGARGERVIETENGEVRILFTNRALANAEAQLNRGVFEVLTDLQSGGRIGDVAVLLQASMEAARRDAREGGKPVSLARAYEVLDDVGYAAAAIAVVEAVAEVVSYTREGDAGIPLTGDGADPN